MKGMLLVGLGGALGAMMRYGISLLPIKSEFPILTLITNLLGAVAIGFIIGAFQSNKENEHILLFLKTGVCGGFTTFSTFSLEALTLFQNRHFTMGTAYALTSVCFCILGVALGNLLSSKVFA